MSDLSKRILDLKRDLEEDEKELQEAQAEYKVLMGQLKSEHKLSSIEEAQKEVKQMTKIERDLATKIEKTISDIEEQYDV